MTRLKASNPPQSSAGVSPALRTAGILPALRVAGFQPALLFLFLFLSFNCFAQEPLLPSGTKLFGFWGGVAPTTPAWGGLREFQVMGRKFGIAALEFRYVFSSRSIVSYHYHLDV